MTSAAVWMERLRSKASSYKSLAEQSKNARTTLLDRRFGLDTEDKAVIRVCLDHLSESILIRDAISMAERLESIARKISSKDSRCSGGLKFVADPVHGCFYLSTEMFFVEINIDSSEKVTETKIHHIDATQQHQQTTTKSCPELTECIAKGEFAQFVQHLHGLMSVYDLPNSSAADKTRAWSALTCLEQDLETLYSSYRGWSTDATSFVHQTPLGYLQPRAGGMPLKLIYFLRPCDLMNENEGLTEVSTKTLDTLFKQEIGHSVTVCLEKSDKTRLLPVTSILASKFNDLQPPSFANSVPLNACFVIKLDKPMALSLRKCREIFNLTDIEFFDANKATPLLQLIVQTASDNKLSSSCHRGIFVTLPDQQHCYFMTDQADMMGVLTSSIPFTNASMVPEILAHLRQQALFNSLIMSCVRTNSHQDLERAIMFEVTALDLHHITITFELVHEDSMATVELDLTNVNAPICQVYSAGASTSLDSKDVTNAVLQRTLSIPVTMRTMIQQGQCRSIKPEPEAETDPVCYTGINGGKANNANANSNLNTGLQIDLVRLSNGRTALQSVAAEPAQSEVKCEPMDYENSNSPSFNPTDNSLNELGPQDVAFPPGASIDVTEPNLKVQTQPLATVVAATATALAHQPEPFTIKTETHTCNNLPTLSQSQSHILTDQDGKAYGGGGGGGGGSLKAQYATAASSLVKNEASADLMTNPTNNPSAKLSKSGMMNVCSSPPPPSLSSSSSSSSSVSRQQGGVSILPITSSDNLASNSAVAANKASGIEIILLDGCPDASKSSSSKHLPSTSPLSLASSSATSAGAEPKQRVREIRRSLSEDDKRKFDERKDGNGQKKRKQELFLDQHASSLMVKKSMSPSASGSVNSGGSKRPLFTGGSSSALSDAKVAKLMKSSSSVSISKGPGLLSGVSQTAKPPDIEMVSPSLTIGSGFSNSSSAPSTNASTVSSNSAQITSAGFAGNVSPLKFNSDKSKDRSKSESPSSLKLTIKSSGSSSSKHRDHHHKSSGNSGSKSKTSSSSSSHHTAPKNRASSSSSSSSSQKYSSPTPHKSGLSSSSLKHQSNSGSAAASGSHCSSSKVRQQHDKQKDRDRERDEEVKRLLAGGKLNTTFQIPKLSKLDDPASCGTASLSAVSSASKSGYSPGVQGASGRALMGQAHSAGSSVSPKYSPSSSGGPISSSSSSTPTKFGLSPKQLSAASSPSVSPKSSLASAQAGSTVVSPKFGCSTAAVTSPNISPKHSGSASSASSKRTPSSSPTQLHHQHHSIMISTTNAPSSSGTSAQSAVTGAPLKLPLPPPFRCPSTTTSPPSTSSTSGPTTTCPTSSPFMSLSLPAHASYSTASSAADGSGSKRSSQVAVDEDPNDDVIVLDK